MTNPTTGTATKYYDFADIPANSVVTSAVLTATLGSPSTGAATRTVQIDNDGYNVAFNGSLDITDKVKARFTAGDKNIGVLYRFKANGDTSSVGDRSSSLTYSNNKLTVTYTPPYTAPSVTNVKLAGGTDTVYAASGATSALSWTGANGAYNAISKYLVYRSVNGAAYALLGETTSKSMTVKAPATAGEYHRYYVIAVGEYSNSAAAYSPYHYTYKAPGAPTGVSLDPATVFTGKTTRVSWTAGAAGVGVATSKYEVYRAGVRVGSTTSLYLDVTAPATAGTYSYTVKAIGSVSGYNSGASSAVNLSVQNPASTGSLDRTTVQMDGSSTIRLTVSSADSAFTHKAVWKAGGATITQSLAAGTASTTLTVPLAWCAQFPNTISGQASVTLESYSGSTKTGENTYAFTVTVPNSVVPTFASLGASLVANGVDASITKYVQGYSSVKLTINSPAGAQGSSITSYSISGGGFTAATAQTTTYGVLNTPGSITFTGKITDSRGRTATKTVTITVEPYGSPSLSGAVAYRCNSSGAKLSSGTYALLKATSVFSSIGGQNTATLKGRVYMVGATPGAWQSMTSGANLVTGNGNILVVKTYIAEITIADKISNFTLTYTIPTDTPSFHALDGALGAGIGKYAEATDELQIPEHWRARMNLQIKDIRGTNPAPEAMPDNALSTFFNDQYGNGWRSGITVRGWNATYQTWQLAAPSSSADDENLFFRVGRGASWGAWRTLLTDGNWSSYVTLSSLGAAASDHGHNYGNISILNYDGTSMNNNKTTGFSRGYNMTNAAVTDISSFETIVYSPDWITQIQHTIGATPEMYIRSWHSGTTWGSWYKFLHSGNYNSYAPTKTGDGASGTWGISITGNAASATKLATARTFTIGNTGNTFNGSANVSWSLAEIGAQKTITYGTSLPQSGMATGDIFLLIQ